MGAPPFLVVWRRKNLKLANVLPILLLLNGLFWGLILVRPADNLLHLKIYAVGEGDAIFIRTPSGKKILIDGGPGENVIRLLSEDLPFYERTLDLVILTHPHADHLNGLLAVLRRYRVKRVLYNQTAFAGAAYREFQRLLAEKKIAAWSGWAGEVLRLDERSVLKILWPPRHTRQGRVTFPPPPDDRRGSRPATELSSSRPLRNVPLKNITERGSLEVGERDSEVKVVNEDPNATSLVLLLNFGDFSALLTDDAPAAVQDSLTVSAADDVEVLKVPHHGAATSLNEAFLERLQPELAVISVGRNSYGHPTSRVLGAYAVRNIPLLRTDRDGTVEVVSDGRSWSFRTLKGN